MKKLVLGLVAMVLVTSISFGQSKITVNSCVSEAEYKTLDQDEKKIVDLVNGAISGLKGVKLDDLKSTTNYAIVSFSSKNGNLNGILIASNENSTDMSRAGSCEVCGVSTAYACIKRIKSYMASQNTTEIDIHVSLNSNGCATVSW